MQEDFDAWNARADRFDGFDRGDLDRSYSEERQAKNEYESGDTVSFHDLVLALEKLLRVIDRMPSNSADGVADECRELLRKAASS